MQEGQPREEGPSLDLSVVAPARDEEANIGPLVAQVDAAVSPLGLTWEFIVVDDGSTDGTRRALLDLARERPWLRALSMTRPPAGKGAGQSAVFWAGFRAARGRLIATLDADLQNDPGDLGAMLALMSRVGADMVQGDRSASRQDSVVRRAGSVVGRVFRRMILGDAIRDTGCSLRVMTREVALLLPLEFRGAHRFIPVTARRLGFKVVETPVRHRARTAGETKYGMGVAQRAIPGLIDCFAMRWMYSRRRWTDWREETPAGGGREGADRRASRLEGAAR